MTTRTTTTNFGDGWKTGAERLVRCSDNGGGVSSGNALFVQGTLCGDGESGQSVRKSEISSCKTIENNGER